MNELQVKTIEIQPAVIEFNHEEIEKELEANLKKYEGLVFSEENATDLRKTIAELRKGKNAVDRYRIDTKKKLNEPVKEFENKCKQLDKRFDNVITPLVEQQKEFEEKRRAEKLKEVEAIRLEHIENYGLAEEYHNQVTIDDSMLTKSASIKQVRDTLEFQVQKLKNEQDKKESDIQLINTTVELANAKNELGFSADAYVRLLEFKPVEEITKQVELDAENEVNKRKIEQESKERREREKQAELERIERELVESIKEEEKAQEQPAIEREYEQVPLSSAPASKSVDDIPFADDPFLDDPFKETIEIPEIKFSDEIEAVLKLKITENNLNELLKFLKEKEITYEVIEE